MRLIPQFALMFMAFLSSGAFAQNAYFTHLNVPRYIKAGVDFPITVRARNAGGPNYEFFQLKWRLDGGTVHTMNQAVGGGGIIGNNNSYLEVTHPNAINAVQGEHELEVWIDVPGDPDHSNDTATVQFTALGQWAPKVVLMEVRTESWCPFCPPANTVSDQLLHDPAFAVVKFHLNDGMEIPGANDYYNYYDTTFTPAASIELGEYGSYLTNASSNQWPLEMTDRAAGVSPVIIAMDADLDPITRELSVTIAAEFTYAMNGPFKFNVHLAENHVPGTQNNAPSPYTHNGVLRAILGGVDGTTDAIPDQPAVGTGYSHTYTYTVPQEFDLASLYLVGFVEHAPSSGGRYALNSISSMHAPVGISDRENDPFAIAVFPNPFTDRLSLVLPEAIGPVDVEVIGIDGSIVFGQRFNSDRIEVQLPQLSAGSYLLRVKGERSIAVEKLLRVEGDH